MTSRKHLEYVIEEGISHIDWPCVHGWLTSSYWSPGISRDQVERAARHSALLLSAFTEGQQVAYLRVISDKTRFAYLCDIWVDAAHRRQGLARAMVRCALEHPDFLTVGWMLATADAHTLYAPLGFKPLVEPERFMRRKPTGAELAAAPTSRPPSHFPESPDVQPSDSQRTPPSGGGG
jgi:ribosomal protein S18 acetylase RimI-like enzyme